MSQHATNGRLHAHVREEATQWLIAFSEGDVDAAAREDFSRWLRTSPEHVRAYLRMSAFWEDAGAIVGSKAVDLEALVLAAKAQTNVISWPNASTESTSDGSARTPGAAVDGGERAVKDSGARIGHPIAERSAWLRARRFMTVAACVVIVIGGGVLIRLATSSTFVTTIGEQRTLTLEDGSSVTLNARSRIDVRFNKSRRVIELRDGQALFRVARDPHRPFIVRSDGVSVRAIGTEFDVHRTLDQGTVVTVLEGRVAVETHTSPGADDSAGPHNGPNASTTRNSPREQNSVGPTSSVSSAPASVLLSAGERAIAASQEITLAKPAAQGMAAAWRDGLLVFDSAQLSEVVDEFNRQNRKPLVLEDASLGTLRISGIFPANGAERLTAFLHERFAMSVHDEGDAIRITRH